MNRADLETKLAELSATYRKDLADGKVVYEIDVEGKKDGGERRERGEKKEKKEGNAEKKEAQPKKEDKAAKKKEPETKKEEPAKNETSTEAV